MIEKSLPIGSLKRDEIFTFIGGMYIALSWILYFMIIEITGKPDVAGFLNTVALVFVWLSSVIVLYPTIIVLKAILNNIGKRFIKNKDDIELGKFININVSKEAISMPLISFEQYEELFVSIHIMIVIIGSMLMSAYPILIVSYYYFTFISLVVIVVLFTIVLALMIYRTVYHLIEANIFDILYKKKLIELYSLRVHSDEIGKMLSRSKFNQ